LGIGHEDAAAILGGNLGRLMLAAACHSARLRKLFRGQAGAHGLSDDLSGLGSLGQAQTGSIFLLFLILHLEDQAHAKVEYGDAQLHDTNYRGIHWKNYNALLPQ